ncbi:MAG: ATP-binding protein [Methanomicrobiales archaeon]
MGCSKCGRPGVIFQEYSGLHLCREHFREDFLHKAKKTVRKNHWLVPGEQYAVALSGGPASCALLDFMRILVGERKDIHLMAVTMQHNDPDRMENARAITEALDIPWFVIPEENATINTHPDNGPGTTNHSPFLTHVSAEYHLSRMADQLKIDALVLGYTLEDHAEWVLWNAISGTGIQNSFCPAEGRKTVRIIRPFTHISRQELDLYTRLFLNDYYRRRQVETKNCMDDPINAILEHFYGRHPGVPFALVNIGEQLKKFRDQVS